MKTITEQLKHFKTTKAEKQSMFPQCHCGRILNVDDLCPVCDEVEMRATKQIISKLRKRR